jgi:hypothetical protein
MYLRIKLIIYYSKITTIGVAFTDISAIAISILPANVVVMYLRIKLIIHYSRLITIGVAFTDIFRNCYTHKNVKEVAIIYLWGK